MKPYHKIQTVFKRDPATKCRTLLEGEYSLPEFEYLKDCEWVLTEKVDGTNIRVMFDGENLAFGGKTDNAQIPAPLFKHLEQAFMPLLKRFKESYPNGVCLYGEGYGAKIQKGGGNYRTDQSFVLFDVLIGDWWLERKDIESVATHLRTSLVPILSRATLPEMVESVRAGFNSTWGNFRAEGYVARPSTELKTRAGNRIITKLKCKDFA